MVVIIDYDMGNIGSVANMLKKIGKKAIISRDPEKIQAAERLILPGVGAFDKGMEHLENLDLIPLIRQRVIEEKIPILGICLGAQLMLNGSEEGQKQGLSLLPGNVVKFKLGDSKLRVPHMGWTHVEPVKKSGLTDVLPPEPRFYFVHSYHFMIENEDDELLRSDYGYSFCSAFQHNHIMGVQFHPEKSHKFGMALLKNFTELV
jgi:imidazole glycerol-phosphate synthase subunit HisH